MKTCCYLFILCAFFHSCKRDVETPIPDVDWNMFQSAPARSLSSAAFTRLNGVYRIEQGTDDFGGLAAVKWSYTASGTDTTYHLSFFCENEGTYVVCEGRRLDSTILLDGYWRRIINSTTGRVRLTIDRDSGARYALHNDATRFGNNIIISGVYGVGNTVPETALRLRYEKPLYQVTPFQILAHRGGGRTADQLPASENSVEMLRLASRFGATGVEIDVKLTKDGIPILYHDATLNERVVQKNGLVGPIENYTYDQLFTMVRLINGERIPTLRQALDTILRQTPLQFVWLDIKYNGSLQALRSLQAEYMQRAAAANRQLEIVIGIPDKDVLANFKKLPDFARTPSLVEVSPEEATAVDARIWAPQWTLGLQREEVIRQQAAGRRVFTWTMDIEENIKTYLQQGTFNGILTNYPSVVAFQYYVRQ